MTGSSSRALSEREAALLSAVLSRMPDDAGRPLIAQLPVAVADRHEVPTFVDLAVPGDLPAAPVPDGPVPVRAVVLGASGDTVGEVVVWVHDGRLSALEHAWYSDEPPSAWPSPADLTFP